MVRKEKRSEFLPYEEAKKVVNALGLKSQDDWYRWSRTERPPDIPSNPSRTYKNAGWNGFADWLGKKKRPAFLPYEEAKKVVNALGLKIGMIGRDGRVRNDRQTSQAILGQSIKIQVGMDLRIG